MPSVDFARTQPVSADQARAWSVLTDVERLIGWVSVLESAQEREHLSYYTAVLADRLGPFKLRADLDIRISDVDPPNAISLRADGEDRQVASRITVDATVRLVPAATGGTEVSATGTYAVAGRVATLGSGTITKKAERILDEFFDAMERDLQ